MKLNKKKEITLKLLETFKLAGQVALNLRKKGLKKEIKKDNTPVTNGDIEVNNILTEKIFNLTPEIPIISEETIDNRKNENLNNFWLIDPIDGTNDYINNRDEFTLNAALIVNKKPVIGIINAPDKNRLFYSYGPTNSFEIVDNKKIKLIEKKKENINEIKAVSYSDELKTNIFKLHKKFKVSSYNKMKSSLKFCVIAAGEFDLYVAEPRACEWDIAAGHAILNNAGGEVTDFDGNEILYGKQNFKNPSLIAKGKNIL
jgi:3'(2'), 5'-bisphosphate nucleotidase